MKEALASAHMSDMSTPKKTLAVLAAAAVFLTGVTGCGEPVTDAEREAYESARFGTPEGQAAAEKELARLNAGPADTSSAPNMLDVLLRPSDWPAVGKAKLCDYTSTLMADADRDGNAVPDKVRTAAEKVLERC